MRKIALSLAGAALFTGCSTTMTVSLPVAPEDPAVAYVNLAGSERSGLVRTRQASLLAPRLTMTTAGLVVRGTDAEMGTIPLSDVRSIDFRNRTRGAFEGALVGASVSLALGLLSVVDSEDNRIFGSRTETFLVITTVSAIGTVPVGALLGALIGHRTTVEVVPPR